MKSLTAGLLNLRSKKGEEAATGLFSVLRDQPVAVVAIIGERRSGKSLLANALAREGLFPLEAKTYGLLLASGAIPFDELSDPYGVPPPSEKLGVLFAEHGSDLLPRPEHVLGLARTARALIVNAFATDAKTFLSRWCAFVPTLATLLQERNISQAGDLYLVVRDWDDRMKTDDFLTEVWQYEVMPNEEGTQEELRNAIRFHASQLFRSVQIFFLPPAAKPAQLQFAKALKSNALAPNFVALLEDFASTLWTCTREPTSVGEVTGRHLAAATQDGALARETAESLERKQLKATSCVHEAQAKANYDRHVVHLEELFDHHLTVVRNPETLPAELDALVEEAVTRLRSVLHVSTPSEYVKRLVEDLRAHGPPLKEKRLSANLAKLEQSSATLLRLLIDEVDRAWQQLELPQTKAALRKQMQTRLNETLERLIHQQGLGGALTVELRATLAERAEQECTRATEALMVRNEAAAESLLEREAETVCAQASLRFRELQWQSRDHPYTNRELIALISQWTDDAVQASQRRISRRLDENRAETFAQRLTREIRNLSSPCVLANLENANSKIAQELEDALDYYRHQVLRPQIQACIVNVAAQTRELRALDRLGGEEVPRLPQPRDFTAPFYAPHFLEKTFLSVLLEKADFICSVSEVRASPTSPESRLPPGVPYVDRPATPAQEMMRSLLEERAQGGNLPVESLTEIRVLSADMIDKVWASLKQFVEEDTADLIRRTRQRDELWRKLMRPPAADHFQKLYQEKLNMIGNAPNNRDEVRSPERIERGRPELGNSERDVGELVPVRSARGYSARALSARGHSLPELAAANVRQEDRGPQQNGEGVVASEYRQELDGEVSKLRDLINQQQNALVRQKDALGQATEALEMVRQDRHAALQSVQQEAAKLVQEAQKEARAVAFDEAQKQLSEERSRIEEMVKERIAEERTKNNARIGQIASNSEDAQQELLNDPAVRQKLLELASQQFGIPQSELRADAGKPPLDPRVPLLQVPPLFNDGSREPSGRKVSRGSSRDRSSKRPPEKGLQAAARRANTRTCARCKQAFL